MDEEKQTQDVAVDETQRFKGTVKDFNRRKGFGYITPEGADAEDKSAQVFVHWKQIESADAWPSLDKGQVVEYYVGVHQKGRKEGKKTACKVTGTGGTKLSADAGRTYLGDERFTGTVKHFNREKGFGYIKIEADISAGGETFTADKDVYVPIDEIQTDDEPPALKKGDEVQFSLYKTEKGSGAAKVTNTDGSKYSWPKEERPKIQKNQGWGGMKGMGGMMPVQFINGMPYALVPKGKGSWSGWGGGRRQKREQGSSDADGTQPNAGELSEGQEIRAQWKDNKWYSGKVNGINADGSVKVFWTKFKNYSDSVALDKIRVGGTVPAAAMDTSSGSGGVHKW